MSDRSRQCEPCALHANGDTDAASLLESIRAQRILLAILNGATDAAGEIANELSECRDCTARLAVLLAHMCVANLVYIRGGVEQAAAFLEESLLYDIDSRDAEGGTTPGDQSPQL
jgi:hypothetical protein